MNDADKTKAPLQPATDASSTDADVDLTKRALLKNSWVAPVVITLAVLPLSSALAGTTAPPMS